MRVIVCYKHPNFTKGVFFDKLRQCLSQSGSMKTLVLGDFNVDGHERNLYFSQTGLHAKLNLDEATTEFGTQIDGVYSNHESLTASIHETYYSYHKGLCINWPN